MFDHFNEEIPSSLAEKVLASMEEYGIQEYRQGVIDYINATLQCATPDEKVSTIALK